MELPHSGAKNYIFLFRKFLIALSSFAPVRRGGQVYASLREEKKNRSPRNSAGQALRLGEKKKKELRAKTPSRKGLRKVDRQDGIMQALK